MYLSRALHVIAPQRHDDGPEAAKEPDRLQLLFDRLAVRRRHEADAAAVREKDPVDMIMRVARGALRCARYSDGGRRHLPRFAFAGQILSVHAAAAGAWPYGVEACCRTEVDILPIRTLRAALAEDQVLLRDVHRHALADVARCENAMATLCVPKAERRLHAFLSEVAAAIGRPGVDMPILMSRGDIADHLGVTRETISRAFAALKDSGVIKMDGCAKVRLLKHIE